MCMLSVRKSLNRKVDIESTTSIIYDHQCHVLSVPLLRTGVFLGNGSCFYLAYGLRFHTFDHGVYTVPHIAV